MKERDCRLCGRFRHTSRAQAIDQAIRALGNEPARECQIVSRENRMDTGGSEQRELRTGAGSTTRSTRGSNKPTSKGTGARSTACGLSHCTLPLTRVLCSAVQKLRQAKASGDMVWWSASCSSIPARDAGSG